MNEREPGNRDLLRDPLRSTLFWWLPIGGLAGLVALSSTIGVGRWTVTAVFTIAFALIGAGCTLNALRCGRTHCYFTGPLFLALALASFLQGLQLIDVGWGLIGNVALIGGVGLTLLPDLLLGRYRWRHGARTE